ncbi:conserved hypothetical protein [Pseudomonas protegens Pf-5]|uniref:Uncharacterized protein n=1 Tax=Pseudomonas fluorescens (strain ATCC BAA-477 / NRRL B-23932 / Pf-5) TaxID=220664 RepID=Q4KEB6_PSEF5|nr:conserved hypothetical protein [Pseudomonas protegens Pf-5]
MGKIKRRSIRVLSSCTDYFHPQAAEAGLPAKRPVSLAPGWQPLSLASQRLQMGGRRQGSQLFGQEGFTLALGQHHAVIGRLQRLLQMVLAPLPVAFKNGLQGQAARSQPGCVPIHFGAHRRVVQGRGVTLLQSAAERQLAPQQLDQATHAVQLRRPGRQQLIQFLLHLHRGRPVALVLQGIEAAAECDQGPGHEAFGQALKIVHRQLCAGHPGHGQGQQACLGQLRTLIVAMPVPAQQEHAVAGQYPPGRHQVTHPHGQIDHGKRQGNGPRHPGPGQPKRQGSAAHQQIQQRPAQDHQHPLLPQRPLQIARGNHIAAQAIALELRCPAHPPAAPQHLDLHGGHPYMQHRHRAPACPQVMPALMHHQRDNPQQRSQEHRQKGLQPGLDGEPQHQRGDKPATEQHQALHNRQQSIQGLEPGVAIHRVRP